jgi:4-amino-4-deoxy-L-arabinose transferase-like glycosyltransferase
MEYSLAPNRLFINRDSVDKRDLICCFLVLAYIFIGLIGHDPWKQDETYSFGIIQHILNTHDWVVPTLTGQPFMEKPPLYYIAASFFINTFSSILPLHDAARLTSGFFMILAVFGLWLSAVGFGITSKFNIILLSVIGSLGLVLPAHTLFTDVALFAGLSIAFSGFAWVSRSSWIAGGLLGLGTGIGFMSKGLLAPGIVGLTAILLYVFFSNWRTGLYRRSLMVAFFVASPWLLIWPVALYHHSYPIFMQWFWENNVGRYLGFSIKKLGANATPLFWPKTLPWFTFPVLPMALYNFYHHSREFYKSPLLQFGVICSSVIVIVLVTAASARENYALPLLLPLGLMAGYVINRPVLGIWKNIFWWTAVSLFAFFGSVLWAVWISMQINGVPPAWAPGHRLLPMNFQSNFHLLPMLVALILTCVWAGIVWIERKKKQSLVAWVAGLVMCWGLLSTVLLPWINSGKSYRSVFEPVGLLLNKTSHCIATQNLGESERPMLSYFAQIEVIPSNLPTSNQCYWLMVEKARYQNTKAKIPTGWHLVWQGHRMGDKDELFWLYKKEIN